MTAKISPLSACRARLADQLSRLTVLIKHSSAVHLKLARDARESRSQLVAQLDSLSCGLVTQLTTTTTTSEPKVKRYPCADRHSKSFCTRRTTTATTTAIDGGGHLGTAARVAWTTFGAFWVSNAFSDRPSRLRGGADICAARGGAIIGALRRALFWKFELKIGRREDSCDFRVDRGNSISMINYYRKGTTNSVD